MTNNFYIALLVNPVLILKNLSMLFIQLQRWRHYHDYAWLGQEPMELYPWGVQKGRRLHHCWYEWQGKPDCCCRLWHWGCWHHMSTKINLRISVYYSFNYILIFFQIQKEFFIVYTVCVKFFYSHNLQICIYICVTFLNILNKILG